MLRSNIGSTSGFQNGIHPKSDLGALPNVPLQHLQCGDRTQWNLKLGCGEFQPCCNRKLAVARCTLKGLKYPILNSSPRLLEMCALRIPTTPVLSSRTLKELVQGYPSSPSSPTTLYLGLSVYLGSLYPK